MKLSKLYVPTLKQVNTDSDYLSQTYLYRAGMIKKNYHGGFTYLPYGKKMKEKWLKHIETVFEDDCINEIELPIILKNEILKTRKYEMKSKLFEIDNEKELAIGPIQEETVINQVKGHLTSYKKLPLVLYSKENKIINNVKIKESMVSSIGQKIMKFYCFGETNDKLNQNIDEIKFKFEKIISGYGNLEYTENKLNSSNHSEILTMDTKHGEHGYFKCSNCGLAINKKYGLVGTKIQDEKLEKLEELYTPDIKTIEELEGFLKIEGECFVKSLIYKVKDEYIMIEIPGNHELDEYKLSKYLKVSKSEIELADYEKVKEITGAEVGFAGPLNLKQEIRTIVDKSVTKMSNFVVGANKTDYHIKNVNYERDYTAEIAENLLEVREESLCSNCCSKIEDIDAIELAIINRYSEEYCEKMDLKYLDENGKNQIMRFATIELDIEAAFQGILENTIKEENFVLPSVLRPYDLELIVVNPKNEDQYKMANKMYTDIKQLGLNVLYDDRQERAGAKFKDAELFALPYRVTVGRGAKDNIAEWSNTNENIKEEIPYESVLNFIRNLDRD